MGRARFIPPRTGGAQPNAAIFRPKGERRARSYRRTVLGLPAGRAANDTPADPPPADPAEEARNAGFDQGFAEGLEQGRAAAEAESRALLDALQNSLSDLANLRATLTEVYRREAADLALRVAEQLVGRKLQEDKDLVTSWVDHAFDELGDDDAFVVRCAPDLKEVVEEHLATQRPRPRATVEVVGDPDFGPGDVRVECRAGAVESVLSRRLARIRELVFDHATAPEEEG